MKINLNILAVVFILCSFITGISVPTSLSAEEIFVDAVGVVQWKAVCDRCTQVNADGQVDENGPNVEISVEPGDFIVFRQSSFVQHGIEEVDEENGKKIRKLGEDGDSQIVVELGDGNTTMFGETFPGTGDGIEMTRIEVKGNFEGSLMLWCVVHTNGMTVTLKSADEQ